MRSARGRAWAVAAALLIVAACGDDAGRSAGDAPGDGSGPGAEPQVDASEQVPPGWKPVDGPPTEPVLADAEELWASRSAGSVEDVLTATFHDESVVLLGSDNDMTANIIQVVDAASGNVAWSLRDTDDLDGGGGATWRAPFDAPVRDPVVVERGDGWAVLVGYLTHGRGGAPDEHGVAALDGDTGEVLWAAPIQAGDAPGGEDAHLYDVMADGSNVVGVAREGDSYHVTGIDPSDGTVRWEAPDTWTGGSRLGGSPVLGGDTVYAYDRGEGGGDSVSDLPDQSVVAIDAATGETRWELSDRYDRSQVHLTAADVALILVPRQVASDDGGPGQEALVVEAETGRQVVSFGATVHSCSTDGETLIACLTRDPETFGIQLRTFRPAERTAGMATQGTPEGLTFLYDVHEESIFAATGPDDMGVVLDHAAHAIQDEPVGSFVAASGSYAIATTQPRRGPDAAPSPYAVYRLP